MTTSYEVKIEHDDRTWEALTLLNVREYGARGHDGKPESVALLCRPPMTRAKPIDMILFCPACGMQHIDRDEAKGMLAFDVACYGEPWRNPPHRSHLCSKCGHQWRPADVATNGVAEIQTRGKNDHPTIRGVRSGDTMPQPGHERPEHNDSPRRRRILEREKAAAAAERIGDVLRRAPGEPAPDTEIDMARRQAERDATDDDMAARAQRMNEGAKRAAGVLRGSVFDLGARDKVLKRLRDLMAHVEVPQSRVLHDAISFLESLAP